MAIPRYRPARAPWTVARRGQRSRSRSRPRLSINWVTALSESEWEIYLAAIRTLREAGVGFMLGGGFAQATFTGRWRSTKDIDFYIHPQHRDAAVAALEAAGFEDYFSRLGYDRRWIYRSIRADVIVDIIWAMANQRAQVDEVWFERAGSIRMRNEKIQVIPIEEFLWCKLYILQRDRCDWVDILNLLYANGAWLDWDHLLARLEDDVPLLQGLMLVYQWLCPKAVQAVPVAVRRRLGLSGRRLAPRRTWAERIRLLDSRAWFAPLQPRGARLEI